MTTATRKIPLVRTLVGDAEKEAVLRVLASGQLAQGPEVHEFESEFARVCGVTQAVAVNSGTAAIHCALEAAGVRDGDEVVTTPFTFAATATPILMQRAIPRFVDIDDRTFNADVAHLEGAIGSKTKAVIGVDLFGLPFDTAGALRLRERGVAIIEDACQAIGASRNDIKAGATSDVGAFSLYATKNLMTGEGGMLTTNDEKVAASARRFRQHGQGERYEYLSLGYNYRMTDLAAAIGRSQLARLSDIENKRRANAARYDSLLRGLPGITIPFVPAGVVHAYHQYSILIDEAVAGASRDVVRRKLGELGVGTGVYYPTPLHLNPLFKSFGYSVGDFPVAERVSAQILALPIHPLLSEDDIEYVGQCIKQSLPNA